jgi:16S rRNA U516 pseudouridylate synthase RsuA-like enzyme
MELQRVSMGALVLDKNLAPGQCRELSPLEVELLQERQTPDGASFFGLW